jgi:hypothetical protein
VPRRDLTLLPALRALEPIEESAVFRDQYRDNAATLTGAATLRYGWLAIVGEPCEVALQVVVLLQGQGWTGSPRPCRPACPAGRPHLWAA